MKNITLLTLIVLILSACSAQPELADPSTAVQPTAVSVLEEVVTPTRETLTSDYLNTEFEDATSIRNQLAYGTILLDETENAVTPEQARVLLPLYQAILFLTDDANSVSDEVSAVQNQIVESMTPAQLEKIAELKITNTLLNDFYLENGVAMPSIDADSTRVPGSGSGMGKNLDQASREATRTAMGVTETGTGEGGQGVGQLGRTLLMDRVIALLTEKIGQ